MTEVRATNRAMFWRIIRRLLSANRGRLFVMLLALGAGAAVTAALLNLQVDAKRRLTTEFRAFGANVLITPRDGSPLLSFRPPKEILYTKQLSNFSMSQVVSAVSFLYLIGGVRVRDGATGVLKGNPIPVVIAGFHGDSLASVVPFSVRSTATSLQLDSSETSCLLGVSLANRLELKPLSRLEIENEGRQSYCRVSTVADFGGPEDNQLFLPISETQYLSRYKGRVEVIEVRASGTPAQIDHLIGELRAAFPGTEVSPLRQFTEGEAKIYNRISGLLTATVGIVLLLTALCVMAAMTNVAMERKMDVGLMKAIGGATRRVIRLFLVEAALLGLAGGLIGATAGIFLSMGLGKAVFGVAARPRLIVYPVAVGLTIFVAVLSAFPLRRLASIRPASVFRGEA